MERSELKNERRDNKYIFLFQTDAFLSSSIDYLFKNGNLINENSKFAISNHLYLKLKKVHRDEFAILRGR